MCFFFFKQKTAYERRISDWSSDVCSSDLEAKTGQKFKPAKAHILKGEHLAKARELAAKHHPAWDRLKESAQNLHTRNMGQVLGPKLDKPARFLLPWTVDGGATVQPYSVANPFRRRSEEHTSELQSLMRTSYAVLSLQTKTPIHTN